MAATATPSSAGVDRLQRDESVAGELRAQSLRVAAAGAIVLSIAWFTCLADPSKASSWFAPLCFFGVSVASFLLAGRNPIGGSALLVLGLGVGTTVLVLTRFAPSLACFYVVVVFAGGTLLGPRWSVAIGALCSTLLADAALDPAVALDPQMAVAAAVLVWLGVVLTWAASAPVSTLMEWVWSSYGEALRQKTELRERQGELNRVLKSLNETCYRLEVANQELARARAAADEARQLKSEFAANVSHELRTPLNLIIGFSELLTTYPNHRDGGELSPTTRADVDVIYRNAKHLSNLIDDILDLSQIDAGRMGLSKERLELRDVVGEAITAIARLYEVRSLSLTNEVSADLPMIYADRTRIRQVLINLLNNSARFTQHGGATVRCRQEENSLVVEVADTGVGIAKEDLPIVFEEFRQLDGTTRRPNDGSGLGLAICKRFVEMHAGTIWAESEVGSGTVFAFTLPLTTNVISSPLRPEWDTWVRLPATSETSQRSIVLVSRDARVEHLFRRYLEGYSILAAADEAEALRLFSHRPVHGIVLTVSPDADRGESLRRLREAPQDVPIITCALPTSTDVGKRLGVTDYLVKPISRERLLTVLGGLGARVRSVLVVDDDAEMVRLLARTIRSGSRRYQILRAYGGQEALELLRERRPDAVVLDLVMPEVDGYAVLREMRGREDLRDVPVVAVTARSYETEAVTAGSVEIVREGGLSVGELMACVRSALDAVTGPGCTPEESTEAPALRPA